MLFCKMCIEKKLPPYTYNENDFELKFCRECQREIQHLNYEVFKNKLFDVISNNYKFLRDLPYRAGWFYEAHDEDGVHEFCNFIELLELDAEQRWIRKFEQHL